MSLAILSTPAELALSVAFAASLAASLALPGLARRAGWVDAAPEGGAVGARKLQRSPVPAVGGAICLVGLLAGWAVLVAGGRAPGAPLPGRGLGRLLAESLGGSATLWPLGGVLVAFAVGLVDDLMREGLGPRAKLCGQALAGVALGAPLVASASAAPTAVLGALLLLALGAVVATNAINTFDNADGAAGTLVALGCLVPAPLVSASLAPFLVRNLVRRGSRGQPRGASGGEVSAYLGDSGSHLLGILILMTPAAWPVLVLPLFDLLRLSIVRTRMGSAPWVGDRRHLAHRLRGSGVPRLGVPPLLGFLALPTVLLGWGGAPLTLALALVTAALTGGAADVPPGPPGPSALGPRSERGGADRAEAFE